MSKKARYVVLLGCFQPWGEFYPSALTSICAERSSRSAAKRALAKLGRARGLIPSVLPADSYYPRGTGCQDKRVFSPKQFALYNEVMWVRAVDSARPEHWG